MTRHAYLFALVVGLASAACSDDDDTATAAGGTTSTGGSTTSAGGSTTSAGGATTTSGQGGATCDDLGTCTGCLACAQEQACASEAAACVDGTPCDAYFDCTKACPRGDATCIDDCRTAHSDGVDEGDAFIACLCNACSITCAANSDCANL
jgi:hypothetical protein